MNIRSLDVFIHVNVKFSTAICCKSDSYLTNKYFKTNLNQ